MKDLDQTELDLFGSFHSTQIPDYKQYNLTNERYHATEQMIGAFKNRFGVSYLALDKM